MSSTRPASWEELSEDAAAEGAVAECDDAAGLGHCVVGGEEWCVHAGGDGAGDEEDVGVSGGGDDGESESGEVVVGAGGECQLVFAAVAGSGVDVSDGEAACAVGCGQGEPAAESAEVFEQCEHQRSAQA